MQLDGILDDFQIKFEIPDEDLKRLPKEGAYITVSNHPLGGIDGILLLKLMLEQRKDFKIIANFLLHRIEPLKPYIMPVNPFEDRKDVKSSIAGSGNTDASFPGTYAAGRTAPTILMTYAELKFIEAECKLMLGQGGAQAAYEAAVAASVLRVTGSANTAWLDANINGTSATLQDIIEQKYIANFSTNQPYADYRRTGFPNLSLAAGAVTTSIPTRFPYAQNSLDYNSANVPSVQITDKVWWDQ